MIIARSSRKRNKLDIIASSFGFTQDKLWITLFDTINTLQILTFVYAILLDDDPTSPAEVKIDLKELKRIASGTLRDPNLKLGKYHELPQNEIRTPKTLRY